MIDPYQTDQGCPPRRNVDCSSSHVDAQGQPKGDDMNALAYTPVNAHLETTLQPARQQHLATTQTLGAVVGLAGGTAAALLGALFIAAGWFVANEGVRHWLSTAGSLLLFLTIPLIILAACCLDWMEKGQPQRWSKVARCDDEDNDTL